MNKCAMYISNFEEDDRQVIKDNVEKLSMLKHMELTISDTPTSVIVSAYMFSDIGRYFYVPNLEVPCDIKVDDSQ